jgi:hypothetical protein
VISANIKILSITASPSQIGFDRITSRSTSSLRFYQSNHCLSLCCSILHVQLGLSFALAYTPTTIFGPSAQQEFTSTVDTVFAWEAQLTSLTPNRMELIVTSSQIVSF